jgi:Cdc6-like AAA superfamily ATPase
MGLAKNAIEICRRAGKLAEDHNNTIILIT